MTDIPSADEIRNAPGIDGNEDMDKFNTFSMEALTRFLNESVIELQNDQSVFFKFPVLRDMGKYRRLWNRHYASFISLLRGKGYWCRRATNEGDVILEIALREDTTHLRRNGGQ